MALDPAYFFYSDGTISLENGSDIAIGDMVFWDTAVLPFDTLYANDGQNGVTVIKEVLSVNQLKLAKPWTGPTLTNVPYFVLRWVRHTDPRVYAVRVSEYLTRLKRIPENIEQVAAEIHADRQAVDAAMVTLQQIRAEVDDDRQAVDAATGAVEADRQAVDAAAAAVETALQETLAARDVAVSAAGATAALWDTRATAMAANIPAPVLCVRTAGYSAPGDGGQSLYKRIAAPGTPQPWHFQSNDGAWWELAETTVNPLMFGADGTGVSDATAALNNAIQFGSVEVDLVGRTYRIDGTINLRSDLLLHNGKINASNAPNGTQTVKALGTIASGVALSFDAAEGSLTATVASAATFSPEDLVYVRSNTLYDTVSSGSGSRYGEFARIKSIDGNVLTFYDALHLPYLTSAAAAVDKITPVKNVTLRDIEARGSSAATGTMFAEFYYCENVIIENVRTEVFEQRHIQLRRVYSASVVRSSCRRAWAAGTSYGVAINDGSTNITVEDCRFHDLRHGVAIGGTAGVCRSIKAHLNHCTAMRDAGLDSHPASADVDFSFNTIECVPGAQPGAGIICQGPNLKAHGNVIRNCTGIGIYHQMMCNRTGNSDIVSNEVYGAAGSTIGVAVETATNAGAEMTGVAIRGNRSKGFATVVRVYAIGQSISRIDLDGNQALDGTIAGPGVFIRALAGKTIRDGSVRGNITAVSGTATNVLMQGNDAASVTDLIVSSNRTQGGSYGVRGINTDRIVTATNICRGSTVPIDVVGAASVLSTNITA